ncbi:uncharacterized protein [Miscanthus floridulus]|uniref:uncharacterized protein n=1 Tax=Miscanthus floridulus TaxID=154761 RepID=UPI0034586320
MKRGKGIPGRRRDVGGRGRGEGRGRGGVKGPGQGTLERGRARRTAWTGLAGGAGSSSFSGGRWMARRFSSSSGRAGRRAWAGGAAGAGHLRRVEASGGVGLLRWPAPPPSSSGGRGRWWASHVEMSGF